jgi:uncharacterized protein
MALSKLGLALEFVLIFGALPVAFRLLPVRVSPIPALWAVALYCFWMLGSTPAFNRSRLWNTAPLFTSLGSMMLGFAVAATLVTLAVWKWQPQALFSFVRTRPLVWALVMLLYPLFSVYPQGVIYRAFMFQRYSSLFPSASLMILASAVAFAFSHIIFRSPWSVALTFIGGLLFAWRYERTDSLLVSSLEHALYGCYMFTVGLGGLFYHGATRVLAPLRAS